MSIHTKQRKDKAGEIGKPKLMRAAAIDRFGGPELLRIHELAVPEIDEGEVLIALDTAGVGSWDAEMRSGIRQRPLAVVLERHPGTIVAVSSAQSRRPPLARPLDSLP